MYVSSIARFSVLTVFDVLVILIKIGYRRDYGGESIS